MEAVLRPGEPHGAPDPTGAPASSGSENARFHVPVALHICVIVLVAVTAVSFAVPFPAGIHAALVLLTALVAPGAGATVSLPFRALAESIGMWIGVSLSIDVVLGLAMVWIPWWHPGAAAALAGAVSLVPLVVAWAVRWAR